MINRAVPAGRMASPEEVADAIVFLSSPRSSYVTGISFVVDGGTLLQLRLQFGVSQTAGTTVWFGACVRGRRVAGPRLARALDKGTYCGGGSGTIAASFTFLRQVFILDFIEEDRAFNTIAA